VQLSVVIQAWYPGPEGGIALAELLFGKTDFSGRLPVTFVKHTDDLPAFEDYTMTGRTYRFMEKDPLYTFGYGLSYNEYSYSDISLSKSVVGADENVTLSVKVTNDSTMAGREVDKVTESLTGKKVLSIDFEVKL
jgi:beta-glucosidase